MEHVWSICGACVDCGACAEPVWSMSGARVEHVRSMCGACGKHVWSLSSDKDVLYTVAESLTCMQLFLFLFPSMLRLTH